MKVRVRFAPSPTGFLHIGGARTALFNWLFARQQQGVFILRIEDTDVERSSKEMVQGILESLTWLGLKWDEGPYFQSERLAFYQDVANRLLASGHAYRCFCPPQAENRAVVEDERPEERAWQYEQTCRKLSEAEVEERLARGEPYALRLKVPPSEPIRFQDLVFGHVEVLPENIEDFVILRSDGTPTYHLSVVADDIDMRVTHVIRGVDHLLNTAKHLLLYEALGEARPVYVHLPLILGPDKKRLSKRHGATSVMEYRRAGFLPAALRNYLALLGWNPGGDQEIFSDGGLIRSFDLKRINKANAVFDLQKLEWMNGQYMSILPAEELAGEVELSLRERGLWKPEWEGTERSDFLRRIELLKSRSKKTTDFVDSGRSFFTDEFDYEPEAVEKYLRIADPTRRESLKTALRELVDQYSELPSFDLQSTERVLREIVEKHGIKSGQFIGAVRVALTGRTAAPGIFDVIVTLGREQTLERLGRVIRFLA
ncbi:MAG TPA: glutamate--tRNA ligase [Acidobacteriota bacterium]|nr:glutamate--tRNA ligase [Acidobacteriota bacterium]